MGLKRIQLDGEYQCAGCDRTTHYGFEDEKTGRIYPYCSYCNKIARNRAMWIYGIAASFIVFLIVLFFLKVLGIV